MSVCPQAKQAEQVSKRQEERKKAFIPPKEKVFVQKSLPKGKDHLTLPWGKDSPKK
jgi:hypothetical protein